MFQGICMHITCAIISYYTCMYSPTQTAENLKEALTRRGVEYVAKRFRTDEGIGGITTDIFVSWLFGSYCLEKGSRNNVHGVHLGYCGFSWNLSKNVPCVLRGYSLHYLPLQLFEHISWAKTTTPFHGMPLIYSRGTDQIGVALHLYVVAHSTWISMYKYCVCMVVLVL